MEKVDAIKIELFDIMERQGMLAAENQRLEQLKGRKAQELTAARDEATRKAAVPTLPPEPTTHAAAETLPQPLA